MASPRVPNHLATANPMLSVDTRTLDERMGMVLTPTSTATPGSGNTNRRGSAPSVALKSLAPVSAPGSGRRGSAPAAVFAGANSLPGSASIASGRGTPWKRRVSELQEDIVLALASGSPGMLDEKRKLLKARSSSVLMNLKRGWKAIRVNARTEVLQNGLERLERAKDGNEKRRAFACWKQGSNMTHREQLKGMANLLQRRSVWYAFFQIKDAARRNVDTHAKAGKGAAALRDNFRRRAFSTWRDVCEERGHMRRIGARAVQAWQGRCLLGAWLHLKQAFDSFRLVRATTMNFLNWRARKGLNQWIASVEMAATWRHKASKAVSVFVPHLRSLRRSFNVFATCGRVHRVQRRLAAGFCDGRRLRAINSWREAAGVRSHRTQLRTRGVMALVQHGRRRALNQWIAVADEGIEARRRGLYVISALTKRSARRAWTTWAAHLSGEAQRVAKLLLAFAPSHRLMRKALNTLWAYYEHGYQRRKAAAGFCDAQRLRAFNAWVARTTSVSRRVGLLRRSAAAVTQRSSFRAYQSWKAFAKARASKQRMLKRAVTAISKRGMRRGLNSWCWIHEKCANRLRQLTSAVKEWRGACFRRCWHTWLARHELMEQRRGVLHGMVHRNKRRALNAWRSATEAKNERRDYVRRATRGFHPRTRRLLRAFNGMRSLADGRRSLRKALSGFTHRRQRKALSSWKAASAVASRRIHVQRRGVAALRDQGLRRAYTSWSVFAEERAEAKSQMTKGLSAMLDSERYRAFSSWVSLVQGLNKAKRLKRRGIKALTASVLHRSFNSWYDYSLSLQPKRRILRKGATAVLCLELRVAFNTWESHTERRNNRLLSSLRAFGPEARLVRKALFKLLHLVTMHKQHLRATAGFVKVGESRAWRAWREMVAERLADLLLLQRGVGAMRMVGCRRAYTTWVAGAQERAAVMRLIRLGAHAIASREKRKGLTSWQDAAGTRSKEQRLIRRGAMAIANRQARKAFSSWEEFANARLRNEQMLRRGGMALVSRGMFRAYGKWRSMAEERALMMRILRKGAASLLHRNLRRAMTTWATHALYEAARLARLYKGFHPKLRKLHKAMNNFKDLAASRRFVLRALAGFNKMKELRGFNSWKSSTGERHQRLGQMKRGVAAMLRKEARRAFTTWEEGVVERLDKLRLLRRGATALSQTSLRRALGAWIQLADEANARFRQLKLACGEWQGSSFRRAWMTWRAGASAMASIRSTVYAIRYGHTKRALNHWHEATDTLAKRQQRMRRAVLIALDWKNRDARRLLHRWNFKAHVKKSCKGAMKIYRHGRRRRRLKQGFLRWAIRAVRLAIERRELERRKAEAEAEAAAAMVPVPAPAPDSPPSPEVVDTSNGGARHGNGGVGVLHVVHHHRGLPQAMASPQPLQRPKSVTPRSRTWSTASTRAKAWRGPSVPQSLGAAYFQQLEESQMLAAVKWRGEYEGVPPPLSRALQAADAYNQYTDPFMEPRDLTGGALPGEQPNIAASPGGAFVTPGGPNGNGGGLRRSYSVPPSSAGGMYPVDHNGGGYGNGNGNGGDGHHHGGGNGWEGHPTLPHYVQHVMHEGAPSGSQHHHDSKSPPSPLPGAWARSSTPRFAGHGSIFNHVDPHAEQQQQMQQQHVEQLIDAAHLNFEWRPTT